MTDFVVMVIILDARIHNDQNDHHYFENECMKMNLPCLINGLKCGILKDSKFGCISEYEKYHVLEDSWHAHDENVILVNKFIQYFGECIANITNGDDCNEMLVREYFQNWKSSIGYLKDFHFAQHLLNKHPEYSYITPKYFKKDWLNWWCWDRHKDKTNKNDYRFIYCGPAGSFTPVHHDVIMSYSWSTNINGVKLWILIPPELALQVCKLSSISGLEIIHSMWAREPVEEKLLSHVETILREQGIVSSEEFKIQIFLQRKGQALFVPSKWYHQVHNLTNCLSLNHNWFNEYNLPYVNAYLLEEFQKTKDALDDCRVIRDGFDQEWECELCQKIMSLNIGMDLIQWIHLLVLRCEVEGPDVVVIIRSVLHDLENQFPHLYTFAIGCLS